MIGIESTHNQQPWGVLEAKTKLCTFTASLVDYNNLLFIKPSIIWRPKQITAAAPRYY